VTNHRLKAVALVAGCKPYSGRRSANVFPPKRASRSRWAQPYTLYFEILVLIDILLSDLLAMTSSVALPELQQKYPRAHRCRPQNCLFRCGNSASRWCAVRPLSHCIKRLTVICGGSDISRCT
jgi:hypothetical protein